MDLPSGNCGEALVLGGAHIRALVPLISYPSEYKCEFKLEMYKCIPCKVGMNIDTKLGLGMNSGKEIVYVNQKDGACVLLGMGNAVYSL